MTGYSSGKHLEETTKDGTLSRKFLLFSQYKKGKPQLPAVMLYFRQPFWDIRVSYLPSKPVVLCKP